MGYATRQDMVDRFGEDELVQLTDRHNEGVIDDGVLDRALGDADDEIGPYIGARYTLPLETTPSVLVRIACQIARYRLYSDAAPDRVEKDYNAAVDFLKSVSKGTVQLGPDSAGAVQAVAEGAEVSSGGRIFDRSDNGFI